MNEKTLEITAYDFIDDYNQYLVECKKGDRTATISVAGDEITSDSSTEVMQELEQYLQKVDKIHDLFDRPRLEETHAITAFLVNEVEQTDNNMFYLDAERVPEIEAWFHKSWDLLSAELEEDIHKLGLENILEVSAFNAKAMDEVVTCFGDLQCTFSKQNPNLVLEPAAQYRNRKIALEKEMSGLSCPGADPLWNILQSGLLVDKPKTLYEEFTKEFTAEALKDHRLWSSDGHPYIVRFDAFAMDFNKEFIKNQLPKKSLHTIKKALLTCVLDNSVKEAVSKKLDLLVAELKKEKVIQSGGR